MMLSPQMIQSLIQRMHWVARSEANHKTLMDGVCTSIRDKHTDGSFDTFAYAWGLLPQWARVLLLSVAYRESKTTFNNITPATPIEFFSTEQRVTLQTALEKLLTAITTLYADYHFTDDFYQSWLPARRDALKQTPLPLLRKTA